MSKLKYKSDAEAFLQLAAGNIGAYRFLFDQYFADLCNFLMIYLHSQELAEETALEIFAYVWEKRETLQIRSSFRSFLFASAKNRAISQYRKEQKQLFTSIDEAEYSVADETGSHHFLEIDELRILISQAVEKLPEKSRQIYQMAWEEDMSYREIAEEMGIAVKTVENHVGIALRKLREILKPYYKQIFIFWISALLIR